MHVIALNQPYGGTPQEWPEGAQYACRNKQHELLISYKNPTPEEINAIQTGEARFAFVNAEQNIFFCYKFGEQPWADTTFNWHRQQPEDNQAPPLPSDNPNERSTFAVVFIDATDGTVRAMRFMTFSHQFSNGLATAIQKQIETPYDAAAQAQEIQQFFAQYQSSQLATLVASHRCIGGM